MGLWFGVQDNYPEFSTQKNPGWITLRQDLQVRNGYKIYKWEISSTRYLCSLSVKIQLKKVINTAAILTLTVSIMAAMAAIVQSPRNRFELLRKLQTKESIVLKQPTWDFSKRNRQSVDPIQQHMNRSPTAQARQEVIKFLYIVQQVVFF